jgi:hypothetical protein
MELLHIINAHAGQLCNVRRVPRLRGRNSLIELDDFRFGMVADRTFESPHIVPRPLEIYARKHHAGAAFRTARLHDRACRCVSKMATRHLCSPLLQTGPLPNWQTPDWPVMYRIYVAWGQIGSHLFSTQYFFHLFPRLRRARVRLFYCTAVSNFAQTRPSHRHLLPEDGCFCGRGAASIARVIGGSQQLSLRPAGAPPRLKECNMDTQTLLIIIVIVLLIGGGGWYGRGRWY